jgi:hypothetical protein
MFLERAKARYNPLLFTSVDAHHISGQTIYIPNDDMRHNLKMRRVAKALHDKSLKRFDVSRAIN